MTIKEFEKTYRGNLNTDHLEKFFPPEKTQNGICFKLPINNLKKVKKDTIVYIGEYAYTEGLDRIYTAGDFFEIAKDYAPKNFTKQQIENLANFIFEMIDWQPPQNFANEIDFDEE
jgi:hypothetical protein